MLNLRISGDELAGWCRRVGVSTNAGLDLLRVVKRESQNRPRSRCWREVAESVERGDSLHEALYRHKERLNELFLSMVKVGEDSGHLGETLLELADYYEQMSSLRKTFLRSIMMPVFELCLALGVVGLVILILGMLPVPIDILGLGLIGMSGFIKYVTFLAMVFGFGIVLFWYLKNNAAQLRFVQHFVNPIPKIGPIFRTLALTRFTQALFLTMRTGMDLKRALTLSFEAAAYGPITDKLPIVLDEIERGGTLYEAFFACRFFEDTMMMFVQSGEESGDLPEAMHRLSKEYLQQCVFRLRTLSVIGFFLVFILVAGIIIFFIFSIFSFYLGAINDAANF